MFGFNSEPFADFPVDVHTSNPPADLVPLIEDVDDPEEGFFGPDSMYWHVNRENVIAAGGVTAILLQIAHPKVAAGVQDHSSFESDPVGRAERTREIVEAITFGDLDTAVEASMIIRQVHDWVTGDLQEDAGPYEAGDRYEANEPDNLLWVHATMIEQGLTMYDLYVGTLTEAETEQFYQEAKLFGQLFGIPRENYPETLEDFWAYYERELEETIIVSERGHDLQETLFSGNMLVEKMIPGDLLERIYGFYGAARMPDPTREQFDFEWSQRQERAYQAQAKAIRRALPYLPHVVRFNPTYRERMQDLQLQPADPAPPTVDAAPANAD
jgi:uncharacterized protein (DUF2236 family)